MLDIAMWYVTCTDVHNENIYSSYMISKCYFLFMAVTRRTAIEPRMSLFFFDGRLILLGKILLVFKTHPNDQNISGHTSLLDLLNDN